MFITSREFRIAARNFRTKRINRRESNELSAPQRSNNLEEIKKPTHFDDTGKIRMVDVGNKDVSVREARASAMVMMNHDTLSVLASHQNPKGNPLEIARIAGIMAAKKTSELIPLCHQLNLSKVGIEAELVDNGVSIEATVKTAALTGVEMEALTAVSVAALTIYDMCKAIQKDIVITDIRLESKTGGKSDYQREQ
jgi:cyclic pyranopterin phosphate synthase